jgi:acetate kinase
MLTSTPHPQLALLVINAGSSSIKFALFDDETLAELVKGQIDGIGSAAAFRAKSPDKKIDEQLKWPLEVAPKDHSAALQLLIEWLGQTMVGVQVAAVGHRVVHGGTHYMEPVVIDEAVLDELESIFALAPLHEPHNIAGIKGARAAFGDITQVACFDTAFHRTQSFINDTYALPRSFYLEGIRRYGFHGLSYEFIAGYLKENFPQRVSGKCIVAHLGNGASLCAIENGQAVSSTMGFTPLEGLPMGSRSGRIDPGVLLYLMQHKKWDAQRISDMLYKESGLKGLSGGLSNDMRTLEASDSNEANEAIEYFVQHVQQEIASLAAIMRGVDTLVFTGGIGENSVLIRKRVMYGLRWLGLRFDDTQNALGATVLSQAQSDILCLRIPTNEEGMIARHTKKLAASDRVCY